MSEKKPKLREGRFLFNEGIRECEPVAVPKKASPANHVNTL